MRPPTTRSPARLGAALAAAGLATGCAASLFGDKKPAAAIEEVTQDEGTPLVADFAHPYGLNPVKVESVALVTGLKGTGEDPPQSPQRAALLDEMRRRGVERPNEVLASPDTALVLLRGFLPPGVQRGDPFDLEVHLPSRSKTTSLRGGRVLEARLTELAALGGQLRTGHVLAKGEGDILVDPAADAEDLAAVTRGRILGGGTAIKSRPLGLVLAQNKQSVRNATLVAKAVSDRFQTYEAGHKIGVAEAKTDEFIELVLHPRYKDNIGRYVRVVRSVPVSESAVDRQERLQLLERQLLDPLTAATAALRLEAIGDESVVETLRAGLGSDDSEVRFYASEALAYLDKTEGVAALVAAARDEPAFRWHALGALSAMEDVVAYEGLRSLLASPSAETRYGAFRALWAMNASDPLIRGETLGGHFGFHALDVEGPPMIHATRSGRPEIVLFGAGQRFKLPLVLDAGRDILVNGLTGDEVTVSRFRGGEPGVKRTVPPNVDEVVRAIVEVGGDYPDVVQALQQAKRDGALEGRFAVDAIPRNDREYHRDDASLRDKSDAAEPEESAPEAGEPLESDYRVGTPLPDLFSNKK